MILAREERFAIHGPIHGWIAELKNVPIAQNACNTRRTMNLNGLLLMLVLAATGCQNGPVMGRMKQNQLENERLLSEFRSQQREVEQLRADRQRLLQQQAETEKLAAKLQAQLNGRREFSGSPQRTADRSISEPTRLAQERRDRTPDSSDQNASRTSSDSLNWRPIRKPGL